MLERLLLGFWIFLFWTQVHSLTFLRPLKLGMGILALALCLVIIRYGVLGINPMQRRLLLFAGLCLANLSTPILTSIANENNLSDLMHPSYWSWVKIMLVSALLPLVFTEWRSKSLMFWNGVGIACALGTVLYFAWASDELLNGRLHTSYSKFGDANALATVIGSVLPFLFFSFGQSTRFQKLLIIGFFVILSSILIMSKSRMGIASAFVSSLFYLYSCYNGKKSLVVLGFSVFIAIVASLILIFDSSFFDRFTTLTDGSALNRFQSWQLGFHLLLENPLFGVGVDGAKSQFYELGYPSPLITYSKQLQVHNLWLQITADLGFVGLLVFSALIFLVLAEIKKNRKYDRAFYYSSVASFLCLMLNSLTIPMLYLEFWVFLMAVLFTINSRQRAAYHFH